MRVAVIGAGAAGLAAGHRLTRAGHECDVYERWPGLGGQVATLDLGDGTLLERYYHHLFTTDAAIAALYDELGLRDRVAAVEHGRLLAAGRSYAFTSPLDLLRFTAMSLRGRIRMGVATLLLQRRHKEVEPFESVTAHDWVRANMGPEAWDVLWGPLLHGKYGPRADDISMAWLWSKLTLRRRLEGKEARGEMLGYPRGGFQPLLERLRESIESGGGRVLIDRPAKSIAAADSGLTLTYGAPDSFRRGHDPREFEAAGQPERYDAVIATVPSDVFAAMVEPSLADRLDPRCIAGTSAIPYQTALCVLLELDRQFGRFYWTNVADDRLPFIGLIEQTNLIGPEHYGGRHLLYVANYVEPGDPLLGLGSDQLIDAYAAGLKLVNPGFDRSWIRNLWVFREPAAQPVVTLGYRDRMPPLDTGVPGLILANTTQIYPEDRGTNYSVELADRAIAALDASLSSAPS